MTTTSRSRYKQYLQSEAWLSIKASCLAERGHVCERCGSGFRIEVHHREYPKTWGTETPDMLEVLCHKCHLSHHIQTASAIRVTKKDSKWRPTPQQFRKWLRRNKKNLKAHGNYSRNIEHLLKRGSL